MPRYYFHIVEAGDIIEDDEGVDLPDLAAAQDEARESAREIATQRIRSQRKFDDFKLEIRDELGAMLDSIHVRDVLR